MLYFIFAISLIMGFLDGICKLMDTDSKQYKESTSLFDSIFR
jgi:hypothetical protein